MNKFIKAINALENGNLEKAFQYINEVKEKGKPEEKYDLAHELFQLGFLDHAKDLFTDLFQEYPDEGELKIRLAEVLIEMDDIEQALLILEEISENDPDYTEALLLLADLYQMQGLWEVSEQKLLQAENRAPDEEVVQFALAELYASVGRFAQAVRRYEQILSTMNEIAGVNIYERLAETYSAAGEFEKALHYFEEANKHQKLLDINTLFKYGFTAYHAGYWKTAIEKFNEVITLDPEYQSVYLLLAKCYEHENDLEKSWETIQKGLKVNDFQKELYFYGGKILLKLQNQEKAEQMLREAIAIDPSYIDPVITLNKILLHDHRYEEVIELSSPLIQEGEEDPEILWDLAISYQHMEQYSESLNCYRQAYNFLKDNEQFLQNFGEFLMEEGKRGEAIEIYNKLVQLDPGNVEYTNTLEHLLMSNEI